jgi:import inner membrane translocase subunit TIM17
MEQQSPCPHRIIDDMGSAFAMGAVGGTVWHFFKGVRNSPRGDRIRGGYNSVTLRAPTTGGNFAVWGGLFAVYDCSLLKIRKKEDPWNAILAGALTGGTLAIRAGPRAIATNATIGGVLLAVIEGLQVLMTRNSVDSPAQQWQQQQQQQQARQQQIREKQERLKQNQHNPAISTGLKPHLGVYTAEAHLNKPTEMAAIERENEAFKVQELNDSAAQLLQPDPEFAFNEAEDFN